VRATRRIRAEFHSEHRLVFHRVFCVFNGKASMLQNNVARLPHYERVLFSFRSIDFSAARSTATKWEAPDFHWVDASTVLSSVVVGSGLRNGGVTIDTTSPGYS